MKTYCKVVVYTVSLVLILLFNTCEKGKLCVRGRGEYVAVQYHSNLQPFSKIVVENDVRVEISIDSTYEVIIKAENDIHDNLQVTFDNGTLRIGEKKCMRSYKDIIAWITLPKLDEVEIIDKGYIISNDPLYNITINVNVTGTGDVNLNLHCDTLNTTISGTGEARYQGDVINHFATVSNTGKLAAFNMRSTNTTVNISSSGDAEVEVDSMLNVNISGSGSVYYKGHPLISSTITGTGQVIDQN